MVISVDQLGDEIVLPSKPKRIVSLVPSQSELLFYLGLSDQIVGLTKFCVHPLSEVKSKTIVGGTKKFRFDVIDQLKPDLIIGNKEENYKEGIDSLKSKYPVWMSDIVTLDDSFDMIQKIGKITGKQESADRLVQSIQKEFNSIEKLSDQREKVVYIIWENPLMIVGNETFISSMIERIGFKNMGVHLSGRYPEISINDLKELGPDLIFLSSEPFPFKQEHKIRFEELFPSSKVELVDGEMFSWYGNRLLHAVDYFKGLWNRLN